MIDNKKWCVYVHTVPKEISGYNYDKYYIGITCQNPAKRWAGGYGYKHGYSKNGTAFYNAIQKYGWNNMRHEIILTGLTQEEAEQMEKDKIKEYKSYVKDGHGYNETLGGNITVGYRHTKEAKKQMSIKQKEKQQSYEIHPLSYPVYQFTDLGVFIKKYNSLSDARKVCGNVYKCLNGEQTFTGGYIWRKQDDIQINSDGTIIPINISYNTNINSPVYMFDKNCNFLRRFESRNDARDYIGVYKIPPKAFRPYSLHYSKSYLFRNSVDVELIDGIPHMRDEKEIKDIINKKKIYQFNTTTKKLVSVYDNYLELKEKTHFSIPAIRANLFKENKTSQNYIWRYGKDVGFTESGEAYFIA